MARVASRGSDQFIVRFPDGMRDRIAEAAKNNSRSMNSEIVTALAKAFPTLEPEDAEVDPNEWREKAAEAILDEIEGLFLKLRKLRHPKS